jgi:hypothetical protein
VVDAAGRDHHIADKVPVLTALDIRSDTAFPTELWIGVDTSGLDGGHITARLKWVDTQEGLNELIIAKTDVRWLGLREALNPAKPPVSTACAIQGCVTAAGWWPAAGRVEAAGPPMRAVFRSPAAQLHDQRVHRPVMYGIYGKVLSW